MTWQKKFCFVYYSNMFKYSSYADLCNVSQWFFILHQHLRKLQALFRVNPHNIPEQKDPIWSVAHLLCSCFWGTKTRTHKCYCFIHFAWSTITTLNSKQKHKLYLLGIQYNLGELTSLCKTLDHFVGDIGSQVNTEGQCGIHCLHKVTQLFWAFKLKQNVKTIKHM